MTDRQKKIRKWKIGRTHNWKSEIEDSAIRQGAAREIDAKKKRLKELEGMWTWSSSEKKEAGRLPDEIAGLEKTFREHSGLKRHQQTAMGNVYEKERSDLTETPEMKFIRQKFGIGGRSQKLLNITDRDQLKKYIPLEQMLWEKGPEEALKYIKENSKDLDMDIVRAMLEPYGANCRKNWLNKQRESYFTQAQKLELTEKARTAGVLGKNEGITDEQYLKARQLSMARGVEMPDFADLDKVRKNPDSVKLSEESLTYLKRMTDILNEEIKNMEAGGRSKADIDARKAFLEKGIMSEATKKDIATLTAAATKTDSIYTYDTHLEDSFDDLLPMVTDISSGVADICACLSNQGKIAQYLGIASKQLDEMPTSDDLIQMLPDIISKMPGGNMETMLGTLGQGAEVNTMPTGNRDVEDEIAKKRAEENRTPQPVVSQDLAEINSAEKEQVRLL